MSVNMPHEMLKDIDSVVQDSEMSRAEYIRHCVRQAQDSPFEVPPSIELKTSEAESKEGAA